MLLSGIGMAASMVGGIFQSYQSAATQAAGETTRGNISLGNVSLFNSNRWQQNDAPTMNYGNGTVTGPDGVTYSHTQQGTFVKMPQSQLPVSVSLDSSVRASVDQQATDAVREARANSVTAAQGVSASMAEIDQLNHQLSTNQSFSDSVNKESAASFHQHVATMNSIVDELRKGTTLSRAEAAQAVLEGGGTLGAGVAGAGGSLKAGVSAGGSMQLRGQADKAEVIDRATKTGLDKRFGDEYAETLRAGESVASSYGGGELDAYAKDASGRFSKDATVAEQAMTSVEHAKAYQTARSLTDADGFGSKIALHDRFKNWLTEKLGGNQHAAIGLIHEGAQIGNVEAYAELSAHIREFSQQFAGDIARTADLPSRQSIDAAGRADLREAERAGNASVGNLHDAARSRIASDAAGRHLTAPATDSHIRANHEHAIQTQHDLNAQELKKSTSAALDAFVAKQDAKREEKLDNTLPLELQALSEGQKAGSRPLLITRREAPARHGSQKASSANPSSDSSGAHGDIKVEWPTLPPDAR